MIRKLAAAGAIASALVIATTAAYADHATGPRIAEAKLVFEPNLGQFDPEVRFVSRGRGYTLFLTDTEAVMVLQNSDSSGTSGTTRPTSVVRFALENARLRQGFGGQAPVGLDQQPGIVNYLIGRDPTKWRTNIPTYARVTHKGVYPGVDLVYYSNAGMHEYDLVVAPGGDPSRIAMRVSGADRIDVDATGHLQLATAAGILTMRAPHVYQDVGSTRHPVEARFALREAGTIGFDIGAYDTATPLVIDPELVYSTFLGGSGQAVDLANGVSVDETGAAYIVGSTNATDFPTLNPLQPSRIGPEDAVVTKLSADGQRIYATYLGGSGYDGASGIAVRADGVAYIVGGTDSNDFPVPNAFQPQHGGSGDAFLVEMNREGTAIVRGTYLGGTATDVPSRLILSQFGGAGTPTNVFGDMLFVSGVTTSTNFPTVQPAQGNRVGDRDGFVTVFDRQTLQPVFSSYAGVAGDNFAEGFVLNPRNGAMYLLLTRTDGPPRIAQFTPTTPVGASAAPPIQAWQVKDGIPFIGAGSPEEVEARYKAYLLAYIYAKVFGPHDVTYDGRAQSDNGHQESVQAQDAAMVAITPGCVPIPPATQCSARAVLLMYDDNLNLVNAVNFGGQRVGRNFTPTRAAIDSKGQVHVIGTTSDATLPLVSPVQSTHRGSSEGFVLTFDPASGVTTFFSYLGGGSSDGPADIAVDTDGNRWIVGSTLSADFPVTPNATQPALNGRQDVFVTKISADPPGPALAAQTSGSIVGLTWSAVPRATAYQVEAGSSAGAANLAIVNVGNVTSLQAPGPPGTFFARVRAITPTGLGRPSNEVTFALGPCSAPPPASTATFSKSGSLLTLNWTAAAGATIYGLLVGTTSGGSNVLAAPVGNTLSLQANVAGIPAATYYVRVLSANECGISAASNELAIPIP